MRMVKGKQDRIASKGIAICVSTFAAILHRDTEIARMRKAK